LDFDFPNTCHNYAQLCRWEKQGTLELLLTKPLSLWQIVNGKFLGVATDCTGHYSNIHLCESNSNLGMPEGNMTWVVQ
jgi:ABC-2 type transport system permease protein